MAEERNEEQKGELVATTYEGENQLLTKSEAEIAALKEECFAKAAALRPFTERTDTFRHDKASSSGGFELRDGDQTSLLRSAATEIIAVSIFCPVKMVKILTWIAQLWFVVL